MAKKRMAKATLRSRRRKPVNDAMQAERQLLARAVRLQQSVRDLSRQLIRTKDNADQALRDVGRMVSERMLRPELQTADPEADGAM